MSKILVTGGAGFIGSWLVDKLLELGHEVQVIDDLSSGKKENINPKVNFTKKSVLDYFYLPKDTTIFHLAAIPGVPFSVSNPRETHEANIDGTFNILLLAKRFNAKKVIFASTAALYGDCGHPAKEDDPINPQSPYAFQKAVGEGYMRLFNEVYGLSTISLRFFNVYGKRSDPNSPYALVISKFLQLKKEGKPLTIYGDGEQTRDFVYVDDIVDACIKAMEMPVENEVINICSGEAITINKLADLIGGEKQYLPERKGDVRDTLGSPEKAKELLKWEAKVEIEEGLKLMEN